MNRSHRDWSGICPTGGSPALGVNQRGLRTSERGGDKALVRQLLLSYDVLIISCMDHQYEHVKLLNEWGVWYWRVGLECSSTCGVWCSVLPQASRHPGSWRWKEELLSPPGTAPLVAGDSKLHVWSSQGRVFSPWCVPAEVHCFLLPFLIDIFPYMLEGKGFFFFLLIRGGYWTQAGSSLNTKHLASKLRYPAQRRLAHVHPVS